ncbi:MAG: M64 family metallopeptidase [Myxococcota bacterium]|nr:M64 family metallopeptidase [Myxococcota bacterium]
MYSPEEMETAAPYSLLRCEVAPDLCDLPVESDIGEPDPTVALDLVFLGDGYRADELPAFAAHVDSLVREARADPDGILGRDPRLFNVHRVDVAAAGSAPSDRPFHSCVTQDVLDGTGQLDSDAHRLYRAAANAPDVDLVVVISRGALGRANTHRPTHGGAPPIVRLHERHSHRTLTHELGHAIFHLADEYVDVPDEHPLVQDHPVWSLARWAPNASFDPSERWDGLVDGRREGADRYARGIYRPTDDCRMLDSGGSAPFCPVCSHHIDAWLAAFRGADDGPPQCGIVVGPSAYRPGALDASITARDANGLSSIALVVDGVTLFPDLLSPGEQPRHHLSDAEFPARSGAAIEVRCSDTRGTLGVSELRAP